MQWGVIMADSDKKKKRGGHVSVGESTRCDGSIKLYTGITRRSLSERLKEHQDSIGGNKISVAQGTSFKPLGSQYSANPEKTERTVKSLNKKQKYSSAAGKKKNKSGFW